jgi:hypothetical protein
MYFLNDLDNNVFHLGNNLSLYIAKIVLILQRLRNDKFLI